MRVVSLCSGVGLLDLGLEWAGMRTVQLCEIDAYCQARLHERFPGVPVHDDAWTVDLVPCDVIASGFPCQPASVAGLGLGVRDPRWLWPAIERAVGLVRPRYVILENVPGLVGRGLVSHVLGALAARLYDAEGTTFPAAAVGAPHLRHRVWIVATSDPDRSRVWDESGGFFRPGWGDEALAWAHGQARTVADGGGDRCGERLFGPTGAGNGRDVPDADSPERWSPEHGGDEPDRDDARREEAAGGLGAGRESWWSSERGLGRVAHGQPDRVDRLRALGNGVVPACAELVGLRLRQLHGEA